MQKPITVEELGKTLMRMKNGTSPGSDGFTVEFYKFFWADLKSFFITMCEHCLRKGSVSKTMKEGIVVLLPKPGKPSELVQSYRPITLLNVHYKIISATIANRLKIVLNDIIAANQTAFLQNRFIGDNIRLIYDTIQCMQDEHASGILLSLDIEAAFDSVSWRFIRDVLQFRKFPPYIIQWFDTLYKGAFARVLYNGHLSDEIQLGRSCRQGDALSCYLFILVMDILERKIEQNRDIEGLKPAGTDVKIAMYADDTVCFLKPKLQSFNALFSELGWFAKFSGLKPNIDKTKAMWIGAPCSHRTALERNIEIQWSRTLKILGVSFDFNLQKTGEVYLHGQDY